MEDAPRHPDEATLFDLIEGALDPARDAAVRDHVEECAACSEAVTGARTAAAEARSAATPMPEPAAHRMQLRLAAAWRERVSAIAAEEARADARAAAPTEAPAAPPTKTTSVEHRPPWRRRLVPLLAFVVLAALAGVSISIDEPAPERQADGSRGQEQLEQGSDAGPAPAPEAGSDAAATSAPPVDGRTVEPELSEGVAPDQLEPPPVGYDEQLEGRVCVVAFRDDAFVLPDGRVVQDVVEGPFGTYLVCA